MSVYEESFRSFSYDKINIEKKTNSLRNCLIQGSDKMIIH